MAAYPFSTFSEGSVAAADDGRETVRASNGSLKVRVMYASDKKTFTLNHKFKSADKTTLDNFYGTNRAITWTLAFDGGTSTCVFAGPPQYRPLPGGNYLVTVRAEQT